MTWLGFGTAGPDQSSPPGPAVLGLPLMVSDKSGKDELELALGAVVGRFLELEDIVIGAERQEFLNTLRA
ncbi:hypothetical protein SPONN_2545 [uncultured Candidatus Thioglobus sp.]|nr:hypothetical protein SPONN_2545 [uncultured Candidatus Thioglobus sp.]